MVQLRGVEFRFNELIDLDVVGLLLVFCFGTGMADVDKDLVPSVVVDTEPTFGIKVEVDGPVVVLFVV